MQLNSNQEKNQAINPISKNASKTYNDTHNQQLMILWPTLIKNPINNERIRENFKFISLNQTAIILQKLKKIILIVFIVILI